MSKVADKKESKDYLISKINTLFNPLRTEENSSLFLTFLNRCLSSLNRIPEIPELINSYRNERDIYLKETKNFNKELSKEIDKEVSRIFSKNVIDLKRINDTVKIDWNEQEDDIPTDGKYIKDLYSKLTKEKGINKYKTLKNLIEHIDLRKDDIFSFVYGINDLTISNKCQIAYKKCFNKHKKLNLKGQLWWAYAQIIKEKDAEKINLKKLRELIKTFHEDIKYYLIIGENEEEISVPNDVKDKGETETGGYLIKFANDKELSFECKEDACCKGFRYYLKSHGLPLSHENVLGYVNKPNKTIESLAAGIIDKIKDNGLGQRITLKGDKDGSYRLKISPIKKKLV